MPILLQINVTANWGSTGKIVEQIGETAIKAGWNSCIAYGRYANKSKSTLFKIDSKSEVLLHYFIGVLFDKEGLCSVSATKKLIKEIERINPDIIHLHNLHDHFINYSLLFQYLNNTSIKVVWTFHDCWAFTGHCTHFVRANCMKWKTICSKCPQSTGLIDRSTTNFLLKKSLILGNKNLVIVPASDWMASFVRESFLKKNRIVTIKNGVDVNKFSPRSRINDGLFRILAVSNGWSKSKGLFDIFKLRALLPDVFVITIIGLSKTQIKKLPSGIVGLEKTRNLDHLVNLYSVSDVLINPTYADTFPTVNLEALACGTPVVTYRTGGSPEAVDSTTGIIIEQGDVKGLANALCKLKETPLNRENCRNRAVELYDMTKCFNRYVELYNELINI